MLTSAWFINFWPLTNICLHKKFQRSIQLLFPTATVLAYDSTYAIPSIVKRLFSKFQTIHKFNTTRLDSERYRVHPTASTPTAIEAVVPGRYEYLPNRHCPCRRRYVYQLPNFGNYCDWDPIIGNVEDDDDREGNRARRWTSNCRCVGGSVSPWPSTTVLDSVAPSGGMTLWSAPM